MKFNLSEINQLIRSRRSIRPELFTPRTVHREIIEVILTNATWAPTHGLTQPWRFKVFHRNGIKKIASFIPELYRLTTTTENFNESKLNKLRERLEKSSVVIAICMHRDRTEKIAEIEEIEAVACAVQNMYLSCTAYGLGSFWSTPGFVYSDEMKKFLSLDEQDKCLGLFYIGYTDQEWPQGHRKPLEYVTEWVEE